MDRLVRARVLVAEAAALGLTVEDLVAASSGAPSASRSVPTVSEYLAAIVPTFTPGTLRTYRSYWRLAEAHFGGRPLDAITVGDCQAVLDAAARRARKSRPTSDTRSPQENCVAALRALFARAERARLILDNPAARLDKPRRLPNRRRALTKVELGEAVDAVRTTSGDPGLDVVLTRFHLESGARQEGAIRLTLDGLDARRSTCWLREKFGAEREQPISPSLMAELEALARHRGASRGGDAVFRSRRGRPITRRHYDTLFAKVQAALPWSKRTPVTAHVFRHTAATAVERIAGYSVAEAFLGHAPSSVTGTYSKGRIEEVAAALERLTGEPHPLASGDRGTDHAA